MTRRSGRVGWRSWMRISCLWAHLPHLGKLAALLLCGDKERNVINFQMGGLVRLKRMAAGQWAVDWMVLPETIL